MAKDPSAMTEAELAEWQYAHRDELDAEAEHAEVVDDLEIAPDVSITMSFRLPGTEADAIRQAAKARGRTLTEFIRAACRAAADEGGRDTAVDDSLELSRVLIRGLIDTGARIELPDKTFDAKRLEELLGPGHRSR